MGNWFTIDQSENLWDNSIYWGRAFVHFRFSETKIGFTNKRLSEP